MKPSLFLLELVCSPHYKPLFLHSSYKDWDTNKDYQFMCVELGCQVQAGNITSHCAELLREYIYQEMSTTRSDTLINHLVRLHCVKHVEVTHEQFMDWWTDFIAMLENKGL